MLYLIITTIFEISKVNHVKIPINPNIKAEPLTADTFGITSRDNSSPAYVATLSLAVRARMKNIRFLSDTNSTKSSKSLKNK